MTTPARLKPEPVIPDLERLGGLVLAVEARLREPGVRRDWDVSQRLWPEWIELARSIEHDEGWQLFVAFRGTHWEKLVLYLDAPQIFVRAYTHNVQTSSRMKYAPWSYELCARLEDAKRARFKRLGKDTPVYTGAILTAFRDAHDQRWGRS